MPGSSSWLLPPARQRVVAGMVTAGGAWLSARFSGGRVGGGLADWLRVTVRLARGESPSAAWGELATASSIDRRVLGVHCCGQSRRGGCRDGRGGDVATYDDARAGTVRPAVGRTDRKSRRRDSAAG